MANTPTGSDESYSKYIRSKNGQEYNQIRNENTCAYMPRQQTCGTKSRHLKTVKMARKRWNNIFFKKEKKCEKKKTLTFSYKNAGVKTNVATW